MMPTLLSLIPTCKATSDDKVGIMATLSFQRVYMGDQLLKGCHDANFVTTGVTSDDKVGIKSTLSFQ